MESHLLQMRGLKLQNPTGVVVQNVVASFTDAWIETGNPPGRISNNKSHLLQMRGLKLYLSLSPVN